MMEIKYYTQSWYGQDGEVRHRTSVCPDACLGLRGHRENFGFGLTKGGSYWRCHNAGQGRVWFMPLF